MQVTFRWFFGEKQHKLKDGQRAQKPLCLEQYEQFTLASGLQKRVFFSLWLAVVQVHCHIAIRLMDIVNNKMEIYDFKWPISCSSIHLHMKTIDFVVDCAGKRSEER